ncbi:MAG: helix-turn-helix domain-containing protein [Erysipelotrichaceae bacterium]|nr:helix-turn-helix domain-containing protein [Erysipelotrichaceae bacterium]
MTLYSCSEKKNTIMNELLLSRYYHELALFECGDEECVKSKAIVLSKKNYHLFHYVVSGKGILILNKKEYHLSKGDIFFIPRQTDAIYFPDKEDPWHYRWVGFDGEKVDAYLSALDIGLTSPIINDERKKYLKYFNEIVSNYGERGFLDIQSQGLMYQLFGEMLLGKEDLSAISSARATVEQAKMFINNNYQFEITIKDIARNAKSAPNYLSTIFHREEGMSTKKYLTKVRMENAKELLLTGHFKIKEVAERVGYDNQLHFSAQFKAYFGKSPLAYVKEVSIQDK